VKPGDGPLAPTECRPDAISQKSYTTSPEFPALNRRQEINRVQNGDPGHFLLRPEVELLDTLDHL